MKKIFEKLLLENDDILDHVKMYILKDFDLETTNVLSFFNDHVILSQEDCTGDVHEIVLCNDACYSLYKFLQEHYK